MIHGALKVVQSGSVYMLQLLKRGEATDEHGGSVSYDYSYKLWSEREVTGRYRWTTTTWSHCNATCGTGVSIYR